MAPFFINGMKLDELYKRFLESTGVTTDTRKIVKGNLFFALSGENFDGNAFAEVAINKGCSYVIVDKKEYAKDEKFILVDDCLKSLQSLAIHHRNNLAVPFIGITGTNGKTTTKELISKVLSTEFQILSTEGNLNNHIGVPLTILKVTKQTEIAIIEMGANHPGEIEFLCNIAKPTHGIITNIGKAHLEGFGGFEGVKKTKNELYKYLVQNDGIAFVNYDNEILKSLLGNMLVQKVFYGNSEFSLIRGTILNSNPYLEFEVPEKGIVKTKLAGRYNLENALAAVCIGTYFAVPFEKIRFALESYEPSNQRSQMKQTSNNMLLMDFYNANPSSMEVALENFDKMDHPKKAVILGDMLELGEDAETEHKKILDQVLSMKLDKVILVGNIFCNLSYPDNVLCFQDSKASQNWIIQNKLEGYLILVKGSRGIKLESVAEVL